MNMFQIHDGGAHPVEQEEARPAKKLVEARPISSIISIINIIISSI